ncbi:MFS transporter [Kitasatospora indigofera]|uniref:MFS transporter n=1 Tax=Kitasatospora indigofera TaxID=67307 RepID=A0A918YUD6_9ACTN|nr:MFS transporter [Kitasatospora indigofera]GHE25156.1 MFS transporter [Kitasatospora indigofera]
MTVRTARRPRGPRPAGDGPAAGFDRRLVAPMVLGSILNPVNSSMLAVALVPIGAAFGTPLSQTVWLVSALYLATAVGQPVVGRLVDMHGPRRLYLAGTALVGSAGLLGALAPSLGVLITARVLLGLGTCAAYPAAMHLIRSESARTGSDGPSSVLSALSIANQTTAVIGPSLGGLLIGLGGWRAVFTVNVPLSLACLVLGTLRLPHRPAEERGPQARKAAPVDVAGMALFAAMLTALMLFLMDPRPAHWYLPVLTAVAATGFALRELRVAQPFVDLRVLGGNLPLLATFLRQVLTCTTGYTFMYGFTQWLEQGRGLHASAAGLVLLPMSLAAVTATAITGRRQEMYGKLLVGSLAQIAACALLLAVHPGSPLWLLAAAAVLVGIPQGLNGLANQNALYHQADPARIGSSAGLLRTFTYLGAMSASAADAAFFPHRADTPGLHRLALFMLGTSVVLLTAVLPDRSLRRTTAVAPHGR